MKRIIALVFLGIALLAAPALAGGGPQNVLVVANATDPDSVRIAEYYVKARGIPPGNLLRLRTKSDLGIDYETYRGQIQEPIKNYLAKTGLAAHVDYLVLTRGLPIVVRVPGGSVSVAAILMVMDTPLAGRKQKMPLPSDPAIVNPLNRLGRVAAFSHSRTYGTYRLYLTTFLTGYTAEDSIALVDRALAAEKAPPLAPLFLFQDASGNASQRNRTYAPAMKRLKDAGFLVEHFKSGANEVREKKRVMGYMSGGSYSKLTEKGIASNEYLPGAICDMLESYGAVPANFDPARKSQVPVTWFVKHGITGVHGAVAEPYAHTFPDALLFQRYAAGLNLAESFHYSIPYLYWMNLVIGEPLCTPFTRRPNVTVVWLPDEHADNQAMVEVTAEGPVKTLRLFVDGLLVGEVEKQNSAKFAIDTRWLRDGDHHLLAAAILNVPPEPQGWYATTFAVTHENVLALTARRGPKNSLLVETTRKADPRRVTVTIGGVKAAKVEAWNKRGDLWVTPAAPLPAGRAVTVELAGAAVGRIEYVVPPHKFEVTGPATAMAGEPLTLRVRALDAQGKPVESYSGPVAVSVESPAVDAASLTVDSPEFTVQIRLAKTGRTKLRVRDRVAGTEGTTFVTVHPGPPARFVASPATCPAGEPFDLTVTLEDRYGNAATNYEGEVGIRFPGDLKSTPPAPAQAKNGRLIFRDVLLHRTADQIAILTDRSGHEVGRGTVRVKLFVERTWLALGPLKSEFADDPLGPPADLRPSEGRMEKGRPWQRCVARKNTVDLRSFLGAGAGVAYAHLYLYLPESEKVRLSIGWGAQFNLFIDGTEVFAVKQEETRLEPERHVIRGFKLSSGWHRILLKLRHGSRTSEFTLRISDDDGTPIPGLKRTLSDPERPSRIEGRLTSRGRGVAGIAVLLTGPEEIKTRTLPDGRFGVGGLPEGNWRVAPGAMGFATTPPHRDVETNGKAVTGVDFTMTDEEAPVVRIVEPADGVRSGAPVTVEVEATDNRGIAKVALHVDGAEYGKPLMKAPFSFVLDPARVGYRTWRITVSAVDRAGNRTVSEEVKVRFFRDRKGPKISIVNPGSGKTLAGKTNLIAEVEDESGVASVEFLVDGKRVGKVVTKPRWEVAFDPQSLTKGAHSVTVVARDRVGNETKKTVRFKTK